MFITRVSSENSYISYSQNSSDEKITSNQTFRFSSAAESSYGPQSNRMMPRHFFSLTAESSWSDSEIFNQMVDRKLETLNDLIENLSNVSEIEATKEKANQEILTLTKYQTAKHPQTDNNYMDAHGIERLNQKLELAQEQLAERVLVVLQTAIDDELQKASPDLSTLMMYHQNMLETLDNTQDLLQKNSDWSKQQLNANFYKNIRGYVELPNNLKEVVDTMLALDVHNLNSQKQLIALNQQAQDLADGDEVLDFVVNQVALDVQRQIDDQIAAWNQAQKRRQQNIEALLEEAKTLIDEEEFLQGCVSENADNIQTLLKKAIRLAEIQPQEFRLDVAERAESLWQEFVTTEVKKLSQTLLALGNSGLTGNTRIQFMTYHKQAQHLMKATSLQDSKQFIVSKSNQEYFVQEMAPFLQVAQNVDAEL